MFFASLFGSKVLLRTSAASYRRNGARGSLLTLRVGANMSEFQELANNYSRCYGKTKLKFGKRPVLIIIDAVRAYVDPNSPLYAPDRFEAARQSMARLLENCRASKVRIIYTSVIYETPEDGGKCTSGCVRATALDSMQHGYSPFVVKEACGDRHQSVNDSNLFDMDQKFAEVVSEEDIMTLIDGINKS
ncbi:putative N-carbamoylsarcosine amidase [Glarea lozoyensis 74030]|uniref:Putative N-carbamoylsarcosine amidase n=1 Tax=Glarea lozoyensis (strain ATCC 74030 / MF5533) TaxID=1104152 RepID=H0EI97_GLAL7|nr:putative N-carbamoylsarcosine amidase [Glarea lozoyensis 74030]